MEIDKNVQNKIQLVLFGFLISGIIFALEYFSFLGWVRNGISYLYDPLAFSGGEIGSGLRSYLDLFRNISDFRGEYNALKIRNLELEVYEDYNKILLDQNESLKKQISLGNKKEEYVISQVVYNTDEASVLNINVGSDAGVAGGDVAVLGNAYIGIVSEVDLKGGILRLPVNEGSSLRVLIIKGKNLEKVSIENISEKYISEKNVGAVAVGEDGQVKLENIPSDSGIKEGDSVVVADERVGEYLVLGRVKDIDKDLAATTSTAVVDQLVDYSSLSNIFIRIQK